MPLAHQVAGRLQAFRTCFAPVFIVAMVLLMPTLGAGQIRLHDSAKDDLAKKTREAYDEFTKEDNTVFDLMINNTLTMKRATLKQLLDLNRQNRQDTVNLIPVTTWKELRATRVPKTQKQFLDAYDAARIILEPPTGVPTALKTLKEALTDAQNLLAKKKGEKEAKEAELKNAAADLTKLKTSLDDLKDEVVKVEKPINSLSDLSAKFANLKAIWTGVNEVKDWFEAAEKASNAPGLQLTILDLGVQHQQFAVDRLKLQVEEAKAAQARAEQINSRLQIVWGDGSVDGQGNSTQGLFGQIYSHLVPKQPITDAHPYPFVEDEDEVVLQTIGKLATKAEKETNGERPFATMQLRDLMDILSRYTTLVGYQQYLLLADIIEAATEKHLYSIRLSAINTKEREMLVAHGLEGLAAYHAGGIKPEEIANAFRAVQSIAISVLAGRN